MTEEKRSEFSGRCQAILQCGVLPEDTEGVLACVHDKARAILGGSQEFRSGLEAIATLSELGRLACQRRRIAKESGVVNSIRTWLVKTLEPTAQEFRRLAILTGRVLRDLRFSTDGDL